MRINGWSIAPSPNGISLRVGERWAYKPDYEICLSVIDGQLQVNVYKDLVDKPVHTFAVTIREWTVPLDDEPAAPKSKSDIVRDIAKAKGIPVLDFPSPRSWSEEEIDPAKMFGLPGVGKSSSLPEQLGILAERLTKIPIFPTEEDQRAYEAGLRKKRKKKGKR